MSSKLLVIADTPTENTGFACVVRNTVRHWHGHFERIDIWGINYAGWPHQYPYDIYPAGQVWHAMGNLAKLVNFIRAGDYTHLWILQDTFLLSDNGFPGCLRMVCREKGIRIVTYYPVDAPLDPDWLDIVKVSDAAATFTEYGRTQTFLAAAEESRVSHVTVIPHGVDTEIFRPLEPETRKQLRETFFPDEAWQKACILINVNRNERRKSMVHSLQVLKRLRDKCGDRFRLYLHCQSENTMEKTNLRQLGSALGLDYGTDWVMPEDADFSRGIGQFSTEQINDLYNATDICITTTLGEGWGLSLTEAAAAGMPVVGPSHTSLPEIARIVGPRMHLVPPSNTAVVNMLDNSRLRYAVDVEAMAEKIADVATLQNRREPLSDLAKETLSWERIGRSWLELF